jgi:hypothetical protein
MWFDTKRLTRLHFPSHHHRLNNTATSPPTAIKILLKRESRRRKTSTTLANHDPRMNRTDPKYCALLGILGTWSTSCDFCNCCLPWVFLIVFEVAWSVSWVRIVTLCLCLFWPLGLKNPLVCKRTLVRKPLYTMCSPLSIYVSTSSIDKLKTRKLTLTLIMVGSNSPRVSTRKILLRASSFDKTSTMSRK